MVMSTRHLLSRHRDLFEWNGNDMDGKPGNRSVRAS